MHKNELSSIGKKSVLADVILGGQDGLVNVLGVILGVTAASQDIRIIIAVVWARRWLVISSEDYLVYNNNIERR